VDKNAGPFEVSKASIGFQYIPPTACLGIFGWLSSCVPRPWLQRRRPVESLRWLDSRFNDPLWRPRIIFILIAFVIKKIEFSYIGGSLGS